MKEIRKMDDSSAEEVTGGAPLKEACCELCGTAGYTEKYFITLKFTDGSVMLGYKRLCRKCLDTRLSAYIVAKYPGRTLETVRMQGPYCFGSVPSSLHGKAFLKGCNRAPF